MDNNKYDLAKILKFELKQRNNPTDLKAVNIGVVEQLSPLTVSISESKILLEENEELIISEWFRFRCNIDKTSKLSSGVLTDLLASSTNFTSATGITETHSYTPNLPCEIPSAITFLANAITNTNNAITKINNEILALKCNLKKGDLVVVGSLEQTDKYILLDKVLDDNYKFYDSKKEL